MSEKLKELEEWLAKHNGEPIIGEIKDKYDEWKKLKKEEQNSG